MDWNVTYHIYSYTVDWAEILIGKILNLNNTYTKVQIIENHPWVSKFNVRMLHKYS
jgi:hypothetical protein